MDIILITSTLLKLGYACAGLFMLWLLLRILDELLGIDFKREVWGKINDNAQAVALYMGLRFVGAALLVGMVLS